uniref:Uncharacterized protein n=1 Tax=Anguilla anguilla TaxID=7936 RepID=A0A0E9SVM6_ANGAN
MSVTYQPHRQSLDILYISIQKSLWELGGGTRCSCKLC